MNSEFKFSDKPSAKGYSVKIDERLHSRLHTHIRVLKHLESRGLSVQKWVIDAIIEKLTREEDTADKVELPEHSKDRHLVLQINDRINEKIQSKVGHQKKFRSSYSKKLWIIEAIYEKLEKEEPKTKKFIEEVTAKTE